MTTRVARVLVALALVLGLVTVAWGRPGGGQGYSGGGGGGGYSSGGGGGNYGGGGHYGGGNYGGGGGGAGGVGVFILFALLLVVVAFAKLNGSSGEVSWDSGTAAVEDDPAPRSPPVDLTAIRRFDDEFSPVLFEDFAFRLIAQVHRARGAPDQLDDLAPYLSGPVRTALRGRESSGRPIEGVVIGALRATSLELPDPMDRARASAAIEVVLEVELNYTVTLAAGPATIYGREVWSLTRSAAAVSRPPAKTRSFGCPNCGAAFRSSDGQVCEYCHETVANGRFDWTVTRIEVRETEQRPPSLTGTVEERGTDLATIVDPMKNPRLAALRAEDPGVDNEALAARLHLIFAELNAAWNADDLARARPFVSDGLYDYLRYWLDAYRRQGLANHNDDAAIAKWCGAKLTRDKHYDALTVRVWASGHDYTVAASGEVVAGSKEGDRAYSEYWTLIRGAQVRGQAAADKRCPGCGAALKISMAGDCDYCHVHVTAGEFDWVLSRIEQDDSYAG